MFVEIHHTADKAIYVESTSLEGLFYDSALGLIAISGIYPLNNNRLYIEDYLLNYDELEVLLIDFLNFLIFKLDLGYYLINSEITLNTNYFESKNYFGLFKFRETHIKSATFHKLKIVKQNNLYKTNIIFDI